MRASNMTKTRKCEVTVVETRTYTATIDVLNGKLSMDTAMKSFVDQSFLYDLQKVECNIRAEDLPESNPPSGSELTSEFKSLPHVYKGLV